MTGVDRQTVRQRTVRPGVEEILMGGDKDTEGQETADTH